MKMLQKICFILLLTTFSSVYGGDCFKEKDVDDCRVKAEPSLFSNGDADALYNLALMYDNGKEVSSLQDSDIPTPVTPKPTTMAETVVAPIPEVVAPTPIMATPTTSDGLIPMSLSDGTHKANWWGAGATLIAPSAQWHETVRKAQISRQNWLDPDPPRDLIASDGFVESGGLIASALFILSLLCIYLLRKKETEYVEEPGPQEKAHREKERQEQERQEQSRKKSEKKELDDCRVKAEQGDSKSQYKLAWMYSTGQGVPQDHNEVVKWLRKSAEQGNANAQDNLGLMYYDGQGVPQDDKEATKWLRKSAEQGYAKAHYNLGVMHVKGRGVLQDYVMAHMYWNIAAVGGDKEAIKGRSAIEKQMTASQVEKAQDLAREWMKAHK